jgi:hypothetical protein
VIHEDQESYFSSQSPRPQGIGQATNQYNIPYRNIGGINNIPSPFQNILPFNSYSIGNYNMNNMNRTLLPSSRNAGNQGLGSSATGGGIANRPAQQYGQTGIATNEAATRATFGTGLVNPGQTSNQNHAFDDDFAGMVFGTDTNSMGLYGSTLNSGMDSNPFMQVSNNYNPLTNVGGGGMQQQNQKGHQGYEDISPVPKYDPDLLSAAPSYNTPTQYESFGEDEFEAKPNLRNVRVRPEHGAAPTTPCHPKRRTSQALDAISPATANTSSPAGSSTIDSNPEQGNKNNNINHSGRVSSGGGSGQAANNNSNPSPSTYQAHVPPNRIAEAGPVTHPDPEWRPYGINHWHVFLSQPTLLKYLSSTEIKDIREHCYQLASRGSPFGGGGEDDDEDGDDGEPPQPQPVAEGSPYTTDDAQAVWKHCDAYIRRRSQVRNNQAARRSRQRKDAETRYWKALAIKHGAPDHDFDMSLVEESDDSAAAGPQTRARARAVAQARPGSGGGGRQQGRQGAGAAASSRRASAPSATRPVMDAGDFDFNAPIEEEDAGHIDAFMGGF